MRDDVVSYQLTGPVVERVRTRARQAGVSESQLVQRVLEEVLEPAETKTILAMDCVEDEGELVLDREEGEDDESFNSRSELYGNLFGARR